MSKYLVTGGAGFIGTNLVKMLLEKGDEVVVVDNYAGGYKENRIQDKARYIDLDIRNLEALNVICAEGFDGVFHLAALPRVTFSVENPILTHDVNVNGTLNVLMAAKENKIKRIVFSSSSSAYGNLETFPAKEDMKAVPISPYALHKFIGENYGRLFAELYGLEFVSLRYFNVYGPYFDPDGAYALVIGKFLKQVKNGEPMTVCGDGEYYRDYTHVLDVARANILAMESSKAGKGEIFNIGNNNPHSVNDLVKLIGGEFVFVPERPGDVRFTQADYTKAKMMLGWEPTIKLSDGIEMLKKEWGL